MPDISDKDAFWLADWEVRPDACEIRRGNCLSTHRYRWPIISVYRQLIHQMSKH